MSELKRRRVEQKPQVGDMNVAQQNVEEIDLMELFFRLLGAWKMLLCLSLIGMITVGAYTFFVVTPMYQATSVIYVLNRSDSVINMSDLQIGSALTNDYIRVFNIWEVNERVISKLNLPYTYAELRRNLSVTNAANTRMLDITFKSTNPDEAAAVANTYALVVCDYIAENMATEKPTIMSTALKPANPFSPNKTRNLLLGFLLGLLLGAGIVTVRMLMDDKYKTVDDVRKYTGLPVLATIPADETLNRHGNQNARGGKRV